MKVLSPSFISALFVVSAVCVFTAGIYAYVIPTFFPAYKSYLILIVGIAITAFGTGYIGYQHSTDEGLLLRIGIGVCFAAVGAISVLLTSLLVILNTLGS